MEDVIVVAPFHVIEEAETPPPGGAPGGSAIAVNGDDITRQAHPAAANILRSLSPNIFFCPIVLIAFPPKKRSLL